MTLINPIPQLATPVAASGPGRAPDERVKNLSDLPSDRQEVSSETEETEVSPLTDASLHQTVKKLSTFSANLARNLQFRVDEEADRTVVTVVNTETKEVVRQIPNEEVLALARNLEAETSAILSIKA